MTLDTTDIIDAPRVLCTFPGKRGDLLWALPTVRALSRQIGAPVDLAIAGGIGSLAPLLRHQAYIGTVHVLGGWHTENTAPISPRQPPAVVIDPLINVDGAKLYDYDTVYHLGYDGWPERPLPFTVADLLADQGGPVLLDAELRLDAPWIAAPYDMRRCRREIVLGFTDEYFELKYGLTQLLRNRVWEAQPAGAPVSDYPIVNAANSPRWCAEAHQSNIGWDEAAAWLRAADVFVGCCSALHVLAVATGCPAVVMEPNPDRHHPIFWPLGTTGPQVTQVLGGDGQWTWDARHVWDTLQACRRRLPTVDDALSRVPL